ncbi:MarR family winged helix-turn-helix transcriptional regulator [Luteococcus peritonei]|uniref:MarR family winged helix-turn-helix transcriptional regulator n=1 Tax=Luteococcus peritonei TaxID=88874 RepID=A0ABW4RV64_9ACTN
MSEQARRDVQAVVPAWSPSTALHALDELVKTATSATDGLARRARLSHLELEALRHLMDGQTGPADLARSLHVTSAAATGLVDRLQARGHVEREPHPSDRRRTQLRVTEAGRREVVGLLAPMFQGLAAADAELSEDERVVVTRFLQQATEAMRAIDPAARPR